MVMAIIKASNVKVSISGVELEPVRAIDLDFTIPDNVEPIHAPENLSWSIDVTFPPPRTIDQKILYKDIWQDNPPN